MLAQISFLFGGRIAEEIFVHDISTGASNDFERATQIARDMVMRFGMSDSMGPMVYGENEGEVFLGRSVTTHKNVSETTLQKVESEIRRIIDEQYAVAKKIIEDNRDKVETMTQALMDWETIDAEQIKDILEGRKPRAPKPVQTAAPPAEPPPPAATTPAAPAAGT
jgi:cell division protease FtsH